MSRKEREGTRPDRLAELLASGAHAAARCEARAVLADPEAAPSRRERAAAVLASLAPEPVALWLGLSGVALSLALGVWLLLGGAR